MQDDTTQGLLEDPVWEERFTAVRDDLVSAAPHGVRGMYHVGSTAIPDVAGRPELDVIAVYDEHEAMNEAAAALEHQGFDRLHDDETCVVCVRRDDQAADIVKFHLPGDERVRNQLLFRDFLRDDESARREYERVKHKAATRHLADREAYAGVKRSVVMSLLERATKEGYESRLPEGM